MTAADSDSSEDGSMLRSPAAAREALDESAEDSARAENEYL